MNAIEITNLTKTYSDFTLNNVSLVLPQGAIMGIVGENGAGKSTLINLIMNAKKADSGSVFILGTDNKSPDFNEIKQDIGIVLDEAYFPEVLNAKNINAIMKNSYKNWSESVYFGYIKRLNLPLDKKFKEFSKGMRMKLAIAVALSHSPKLLILDEATSGLDPIVRDEILDIFNEFTRDETHSILISSHIVSDLEKICDYVTFIHKGKIVISEEKDILLDSYCVIKITSSQLEEIPQSAIKGKKKTTYGYDVLVNKAEINSSVIAEKTTLEDIILFTAKEN